ncbi:MAG: IS21-like element helper ATPase IstB [Gemmatimonadaceae bacterium]|jgi:DNA replication protein DnaC|nr:IS21-like element helper ATPase IstB [Gemmatimonadaceae bacterium]
MLIEQTLARLHALKLSGMAQALDEQRGLPDVATLSFEERFALLLEREQATRQDRRLARLLQLAKLRYAACVEDVNFRAKRGLDRARFLQLATGDWIRAHQTLLLVGPTGTGKSWLACALGNAACRQGHTVRYLRVPRLLGDDLPRARADGSYGALLQALARVELLILDDWGLAPLGDRERRDLLELLEDRGGRRATCITSQLPLEHWHDMIGDTTVGDAILDRVVHQAQRLTLTGGSLRRAASSESATTPA